LAAGLVAGSSIAGIVAFAVMGLGLASVFPLTLRAAGSGGAEATPDLAAVSAVGYTGFLAGPPLIGLLSELVGLAAALSTVSAGCLVAALLAGRLDRLTLKPAAAARVS
jgi:hypothetical protein